MDATNDQLLTDLSTIIMGCAIEVHQQLGTGLLESAYETCLAFELLKKGLRIVKPAALPIVYKDIKLEADYCVGILVEDMVVVEIKSVAALADFHTTQLLTYLKLKDLKLGLLVNFNAVHLRDGVKRVVNDL